MGFSFNHSIFEAPQLGDSKARHLVYPDESGMDECADDEPGWSAAKNRWYALQSGCRTSPINLVTGDRYGQLIAPFTTRSWESGNGR